MNYTKTLILASVAIAELAQAGRASIKQEGQCAALENYYEQCAQAIIDDVLVNDAADVIPLLTEIYDTQVDHDVFTTIDDLEEFMMDEMA